MCLAHVTSNNSKTIEPHSSARLDRKGSLLGPPNFSINCGMFQKVDPIGVCADFVTYVVTHAWTHEYDLFDSSTQ